MDFSEYIRYCYISIILVSPGHNPVREKSGTVLFMSLYRNLPQSAIPGILPCRILIRILMLRKEFVHIHDIVVRMENAQTIILIAECVQHFLR